MLGNVSVWYVCFVFCFWCLFVNAMFFFVRLFVLCWMFVIFFLFTNFESFLLLKCLSLFFFIQFNCFVPHLSSMFTPIFLAQNWGNRSLQVLLSFCLNCCFVQENDKRFWKQTYEKCIFLKQCPWHSRHHFAKYC